MNHIRNKIIVDILWKHVNEETLTTEEKKALDVWLSESDVNKKLFTEVTDAEDWIKELKLLLSRNSQATWNKIVHAIDSRPEAKVIKIRKPRFKYVAAVVIAVTTLSVATYFLVSYQQEKEIASSLKDVQKAIDNFVPATAKAILTLANGSSIDLEHAAKGPLLSNNTKIGNLTHDELVYSSSDQLPITLNTLSTPRGGFFKVVLPDGSKVWLNAASSLRFPTKFSSKKRTVELTGEAFFEVAPVFSSLTGAHSHKTTSSKVPFYVKTPSSTVEVVGTHFNVNAYTDEAESATTLFEGSVIVSNGSQVCVLKPGQQAIIDNTEQLPVRPIRRVSVNTKNEKAWKGGSFLFNNTSVESIMAQISRWYQIDVVYPKGIPSKRFTSDIDRRTSLPSLVKSLQYSGLDVRISNNKLVVLP